MVFQKMSKNYSLIEIKLLLENIQDEIFSILLDSSKNSNSLYFQNFIAISLKTIKYLNHYLNVLNHDEHIGSILSYIFQNLQRSFTQYKSRNIYFQSCISSPFAIQNEDEKKQQDQIYHFMNTRNNTLPLQLLGNPHQQRQRMELAFFVENMSKKNITLKQPKRSLQLPQERQNGLKILRKATFDPSFCPISQKDPIKNNLAVQESKMNESEQVQVQTQTECILQEYETQTWKQEEEQKSQAQSCLKSEIAVPTIQNIEDLVKRKNKGNIKNKKNNKGNDGKSSQKKKKAQIVSSIKQNKLNQDISISNSKKEVQNEIDSEFILKNQCSIKAFCNPKQDIKLSSKEVNVIYSNQYFQIIQNQQILGKSGLLALQNKESLSSQYLESKTKGGFGLAGNKIMEVIAQTIEQYNHLELKSDLSCKSQMINEQIQLKISQSVEEEKQNHPINKYNMKVNTNQMRNTEIKQVLPMDSASFNQDKINNELQKNYVKKQEGISKGILASNLNQISKKYKLIGSQQQQLLKGQKGEDKKGQNRNLQQNEDQKLSQQDRGIILQNTENRQIAQKQLQNVEDSHLTPIQQTSSKNLQRFSKLITKSKMEYMSRRLKNKNDKQFESRSNTKKSSLIVINNRNKQPQQKIDSSKQKQSLSFKQHATSNKAKVKLANLFNIRNSKDNQKNKAMHQKNHSQVLNMNYTHQSLQNSGIMFCTQQKDNHSHNSVLRNKKIAQSCYIVNNQSQYNLIGRQLRQKNKRELIRQYLDLIEVSHKKFCGQKCIHIENLYKKINFDGSKSEQNIIDQLLRLIKMGK